MRHKNMLMLVVLGAVLLVAGAALAQGVTEVYWGLNPLYINVVFGVVATVLTSLFARRNWDDKYKRLLHWAIVFIGAIGIGIYTKNIILTDGIKTVIQSFVLNISTIILSAKIAYEATPQTWKDLMVIVGDYFLKKNS